MSKEKDDALVLSMKLASGRFETTLRLPFPCTVEEGREAVMNWLKFAETGLVIGAQEMSATLSEKEKP